MVTSHRLDKVFAVLKPDMAVDQVEVSPSLYEDLDANYSGFHRHALISCHEFSSDWPTWERHPAGDEVVILLSGEVTLVMKTQSGDETVELIDAGSYVVIPRGTWHTARVSGRAKMLFVTPGEGTENEVLEE